MTNTGLYSYNNAMYDIAMAFDEVMEANVPQNRCFEVGKVLLEYKEANNLN